MKAVQLTTRMVADKGKAHTGTVGWSKAGRSTTEKVSYSNAEGDNKARDSSSNAVSCGGRDPSAPNKPTARSRLSLW